MSDSENDYEFDDSDVPEGVDMDCDEGGSEDEDEEDDFNRLIEMDDHDKDVEVLVAEELIAEMQKEVEAVKALLNLTNSAACKVLRHYEFNSEKLKEHYFEAEDPTALLMRLGVRLGQERPYKELPPNSPFTCMLCFDEFPFAAGRKDPQPKVWVLDACGHGLCEPCWQAYLSAEASKGPNCVNTTCPFAKASGGLGCDSCRTFVDETMFQQFAPQLYERVCFFITRSFVEDSKHIQWCPAPGCNRAVKLLNPAIDIVQCGCGFRFCFRCGMEAHAPASCQHLKDWLMREKGEADNLKWITAFTRPCPGCQRPTERNQGCNHMTHCPCKLHWCWECGGKWDDGKHLNNWYNCPFAADKRHEERKKRQTEATTELYKYVKYYEGYALHEKLRKFNNEKDMARAAAYKSKLLSINQGADGDFIIDAVNSLSECRTYLKYTYVYAYTLDDSGKDLFEYNVKDLEEAIAKFNNMLEDLYRHNLAGAKDPPHSRSAITDAAASLRMKLKNVLSGVVKEHNLVSGR